LKTYHVKLERLDNDVFDGVLKLVKKEMTDILEVFLKKKVYCCSLKTKQFVALKKSY
jgi:hypothetical protein